MIFVSSKISDGNMSFVHGDKEEVLQNRKRFFQKIGIKKTFEVNQIHSNKVVLVNKNFNSDTKADGMITNKSGIYLMLKVADCLPLGLYDSKHHAIGLIHAGNKGLENKIIRKAINKMQKEFNTNPKDLIVKIGSSIGPCCYFKNMWQEAEEQLVKLGILKQNIENQKICTYESKESYSHKRSVDKNQKDFRFATILGL